MHREKSEFHSKSNKKPLSGTREEHAFPKDHAGL